MSHDGASVPQYLRSLQAVATDFRAEKLQPVSRCRVHDFRESGLLARQRSMAWLFREAGIAQVEFVQPNVRVKPSPNGGACWTASAEWAAGPALAGQRGPPLGLGLNEGLGVTAGQ